MKIILVLLIVAAVLPASCASQNSGTFEELHAGARAFKLEHYTEAEQHFRKALALDPTYKYTQLLLARTVHAEYRLHDRSPKNIAIGYQAIAEYQKFLTTDADNYFVFKAVSFLYGALNEDEQLHHFLLNCAENEAKRKDRRAECYIVLAMRHWDCSYRFTDQPTNKQTSTVDNKQVIRHVKPVDQKGFAVAKQCASTGLEMIENGLRLEPDNDMAWSYKVNLMLEMAKLAEMEGQEDKKADYDRQGKEALKRVEALIEKRRKEPLKGSDTNNSDEVVTGDPELDEVINTSYLELTDLIAPATPKPQTPKSRSIKRRGARPKQVMRRA